MNNSLVILGRFPSEKGQVKTRLAEDLGVEKAVSLYRSWIERIFKEALTLPDNYNIYFCYSDINDKDEVEKWVSEISGNRIICEEPSSENIELNMYYIFTRRLSQGSRKVVSIASDLPSIKAENILEAFRLLDEVNVVFGPDQRGGFSLFGIKDRLYPRLFRYEYHDKHNIVYEEIRRIKNYDLKYVVLPPIADVDTKDDLPE